MVLIPVFLCIIIAIIIRLKKPKLFGKCAFSENGMQKDDKQKEFNKEEGKKNLVSKEKSTKKVERPTRVKKSLEN